MERETRDVRSPQQELENNEAGSETKVEKNDAELYELAKEMREASENFLLDVGGVAQPAILSEIRSGALSAEEARLIVDEAIKKRQSAFEAMRGAYDAYKGEVESAYLENAMHDDAAFEVRMALSQVDVYSHTLYKNIEAYKAVKEQIDTVANETDSAAEKIKGYQEQAWDDAKIAESLRLMELRIRNKDGESEEELIDSQEITPDLRESKEVSGEVRIGLADDFAQKSERLKGLQVQAISLMESGQLEQAQALKLQEKSMQVESAIAEQRLDDLDYFSASEKEQQEMFLKMQSEANNLKEEAFELSEFAESITPDEVEMSEDHLAEHIDILTEMIDQVENRYQILDAKAKASTVDQVRSAFENAAFGTEIQLLKLKTKLEDRKQELAWHTEEFELIEEASKEAIDQEIDAMLEPQPGDESVGIDLAVERRLRRALSRAKSEQGNIIEALSGAEDFAADLKWQQEFLQNNDIDLDRLSTINFFKSWSEGKKLKAAFENAQTLDAGRVSTDKGKLEKFQNMSASEFRKQYNESAEKVRALNEIAQQNQYRLNELNKVFTQLRRRFAEEDRQYREQQSQQGGQELSA